ncbi:MULTISPECIES: cytochrome P450 [unclassified Streptomyces]|uniref:cytochrome P450 n=1 Tax=unclassified Streptomyces TaxID=2593676 RepID=UPI0021CC867F|nr:cytochrome P450 [Streptomyces sp. sk2.1]
MRVDSLPRRNPPSPDSVPRPGVDVDLTDPVTHNERDLDGMWRALRRHEPVAWHPYDGTPPGFWVVSSHRAATEVYRDSTRFTSVHGNVLATLLSGGDSANGKMLAVSDGERHKAVRRKLLRSFTKASLAGTTERVTAVIRRLVREAAERGTCDFAEDVAARIPLLAICDLLEVPEQDRDLLYRHASNSLATDSPDILDEDSRLSRNEILLYFAQLLRSRGDLPGEGILSRMSELMKDDLRLRLDELLFNCYSLLIGGDETTRLSMIGAVEAFSAMPGEWERLRRGEVSVAGAAEEILRWTTPAMHSGRTATEDTVLEGRPIAAGDTVTIWNNAANFDPEQFEDPDRFDLGRTPNRHLSFAHGPHFCLGAVLARIELTALLEALVEYVDEMSVTGAPQRIYSNFARGFHSLPVRLAPRRDTVKGKHR